MSCLTCLEQLGAVVYLAWFYRRSQGWGYGWGLYALCQPSGWSWDDKDKQRPVQFWRVLCRNACLTSPNVPESQDVQETWVCLSPRFLGRWVRSLFVCDLYLCASLVYPHTSLFPVFLCCDHIPVHLPAGMRGVRTSGLGLSLCDVTNLSPAAYRKFSCGGSRPSDGRCSTPVPVRRRRSTMAVDYKEPKLNA